MRIVIKVGSAVLTEQNCIAKERMLNLVEFISELINKKKYEIILVSSGAVAAGYGLLKIDKNIITNKQTLASIGQPFLMNNYHKKFNKFGIEVSQILLTANDFDSIKRTKFAKNVIENLLKYKILPIINENDVTATEELIFGDNDQLSAYVSHYFDADLLVILTDIDGYYDKNPKEFSDAKIKKYVTNLTKEELNQKSTANNKFATGGIVTKLKAGKFLLENKRQMYLTSGFDLTYVKEFLIENKHTKGTLFKCE